MTTTRDPMPTRPLDGHDLLHWSPDTSTPDTPAMVRSHVSIPTGTMTTNHDHVKYEHVRHMATEIAPGPTIRHGIDWVAVADRVLRAAFVLLVAVMAILLVAAVLSLNAER